MFFVHVNNTFCVKIFSFVLVVWNLAETHTQNLSPQAERHKFSKNISKGILCFTHTHTNTVKHLLNQFLSFSTFSTLPHSSLLETKWSYKCILFYFITILCISSIKSTFEMLATTIRKPYWKKNDVSLCFLMQ